MRLVIFVTVKTVVTTESIPTPVIDLIAPTQITNQDVTITLENNSDLSLFYSIDREIIGLK